MSSTALFDLAEWLATERERVDRGLERALDGAAPHLPPAVAEAVRHGVTSGGKRLRPILCVAAWRAAGGDVVEGVYDLAASLELVHAYSLMHDDLPCMDDAPLRRGRPTTHAALGEDVTMRAGAALIPAAVLQALEAARRLGAPDARAREVAALLARAAGAGGMVGGQWLDLEGEGRTLGESALDGLHRRKTGALLVASLEMGAVAAGAPRPVREALVDYGRAVGLAFQVADDLLDATSDPVTLGKEPSDAELDKSTYVTAYGLEGARRRARSLVDEARAALERIDRPTPALDAVAAWVVERPS